MSVTFKAKLKLVGKTATFIDIPQKIMEALGGGGRIAVVGTIDSHPFRSSFSKMDGKFVMCVNRAMKDATKVDAGDTVTIRCDVDTKKRAVRVPPDLKEALEDAALLAVFKSQSFTNQKEQVTSVITAKREETRIARIAKVIALVKQRSKEKSKKPGVK